MSSRGATEGDQTMMSINGCKTKKALKTKVGQSVDGLFVETSMFGPEYKGDGRYAVVGPSPYERRWYANVFVEDGKVVKVT